MPVLVLTIWVVATELLNLYVLKAESLAMINIPLLMLGSLWCGYRVAGQGSGRGASLVAGLLVFAVPTFTHAFIIRILTNGFPHLEAVAVYVIAGILLSFLGLVGGGVGAFIWMYRKEKSRQDAEPSS
jgi:hypothetical protein